MRKKLISAMLCMTMAVSVMLTGCGGDNQSAATDTKSEETQRQRPKRQRRMRRLR